MKQPHYFLFALIYCHVLYNIMLQMQIIIIVPQRQIDLAFFKNQNTNLD